MESKKPQSVRLNLARQSVPDWYGWLALAAMLLLGVARVGVGPDAWEPPLLTLGEWLLLPLGALSLTMGLLALPKLRDRTLLPLWLSAVLPGVLWIAAEGAAMIGNGVSQAGGDLILSWVVRLVFPAMAFLPLLASRIWRDRLLWTLAAGVVLNVLAIAWQLGLTGAATGDAARLLHGGLFSGQRGYALHLAVSLPLLAAWRGGLAKTNRSLAMLFCMFLLPCLALSVSYAWAGVFAVLAGLAVSWTAWRPHAWILGVFVCMLLFGYASGNNIERGREQRRLLVASAAEGSADNHKALDAFITRPFLGYGPEKYMTTPQNARSATADAQSWYASLLGGSGLVGLGMWLVLLGELAARALGRDGRRDFIRAGGVLGATVGLAAASLWTTALPPGGGALVGFLLAVSMVEDPETAAAVRRRHKNSARET